MPQIWSKTSLTRHLKGLIYNDQTSNEVETSTYYISLHKDFVCAQAAQAHKCKEFFFF